MPDEVVTTSFGKFLVDPEDCIGTTLKAGTLWDGPGFLQPIALEHGRLGEPGVTILDVGANIGAYSVWLARHGAWRVIAVEPVPEIMQRLKANLDLNREVTADRVIPLEVAAYSLHTTLAMAAFDPHNWGGTVLVETAAGQGLPAAPLDDYQYLFGSRVSLIKVDAQGCDGMAILGLAQTIARDHPAIVFEWEADLAEVHSLTFGSLTHWLCERGYTVQPWPSQPNNYLARWGGHTRVDPQTTVFARAELMAARDGYTVIESPDVGDGIMLISHAERRITVNPSAHTWTLAQNATSILPPNRKEPR